MDAVYFFHHHFVDRFILGNFLIIKHIDDCYMYTWNALIWIIFLFGFICLRECLFRITLWHFRRTNMVIMQKCICVWASAYTFRTWEPACLFAHFFIRIQLVTYGPCCLLLYFPFCFLCLILVFVCVFFCKFGFWDAYSTTFISALSIARMYFLDFSGWFCVIRCLKLACWLWNGNP